MDANQAQVGIAVISTVGLLVNGYIAYRMKQLEKNTNSIKDELVHEVRTAAFARGKADEKANPSST